MEYFIVWVGLCSLVVYFAQQKGLSGIVFFFISLFLSPIIGGLIVLFSDDNSVEVGIRRGDKKKCLYCAEVINADAIKCKHCGESQSSVKAEELNEKDLNALIAKIKNDKS